MKESRVLIGRARLLLPQRFDVGLIFGPTRCPFVSNERGTPEYRYRNAFDDSFGPIGPSLLEGDSTDGRQQIDPVWRQSELGDEVGASEIFACNSEILDWGAKLGERADHSGRILLRRLHPDVQIAGRTRNRVNAERMGTDNQKPNVSCVQLAQEITKVLNHRSFGPPCSASVESRMGMVARVYAGRDPCAELHAIRESSRIISSRSPTVVAAGGAAASAL